MIISLFNGSKLEVSDKMAEVIDQAITSEDAPKNIKIKLRNGDKATVVISTINGIWSDEQWDRMEHEKVGDWFCSSGHWHRKTETFCNNQPREKFPEPSPILRQPVDPSDTSDRSRWLRLLKINAESGKAGKYGTLRTLEDLAVFDETGQMPEVAQPVKTEDKKVMQTSDVASKIFPGAKVE